MFIDTHCHLDSYEEMSNESIDHLFARLQEASNTPEEQKQNLLDMPQALIHVACNPEDFNRGIEISEKYPFVYAAYGIHPEYVELVNETQEQELIEVLKHPKAVGCGEFGLDYHYGKESRHKQIQLFERHLQIGLNSTKPLVLHLREAEEDALAILKSANLKNKNIHVHCFTGSPEFAQELLALDGNIFIGFTGILTFKNAQNVRDAAALVPLNKILLETDAPYMAPVPYRGTPCHPGLIPYTAETLAKIKNLPLEELYKLCRINTKSCYGI